MPFQFFDEAGQLHRLAERLRGVDRLGLDCEAAGFHRYSDELCLVQITTPVGNIVVDPLSVDCQEVLRPVLEDPDVEIIMHGADFDLRLLDRDLDVRIRGLFDTQAAAAIVGEDAVGLASLLEKYLDVRLSKKHQKADWARRPLPDEMLEYAVDDTRYLPELRDRLWEKLCESGREAWAREEFEQLEAVRWEPAPDEDPVLRVKAARDMSVREVAALREALEWREELARRRDLAPFRVAGTRALVAASQERPTSVRALNGIPGLGRRVIHWAGAELVERFARVNRLGEAELDGYPSPRSNGDSRPAPEVEALADELKKARNERAGELGIDRGVLLSNAMLLEVARHAPVDRTQLREVPGVKRWQAEALGDALIPILTG